MFILQNQDGYFLSKSGDWVDGRATNVLFRTTNKDEAVNQLFEVNSQDYSLRINILECEINTKNLPIIPESLLPPPIIDQSELELQSTEADTQAITADNAQEDFMPLQSHSA